jgi:hypothetical protein
MNRFKLLAAALLVAIVAAVSAVAVDAALRDDPQGADVAGPNTVVIGGGSGLGPVRIATVDTPFATSSTSFVTVPSATVNIPVPAGATVVITADFTAETACYHIAASSAGDWCAAKIFIGPAEGYPASGVDFALDSTNAGNDGSASWEGHAFSRSRRVTNTTTTTKNFSVFVQVAVTSSNTLLRVDDYHLRVMSISNGSGL